MTLEILLWATGVLGTLAGSILGGYILHRIKLQDTRTRKQEDKIINLSQEITQLKATAVTEAHVRTLMKEEIKPLSDKIDSVNSNISEIKDWVAEERGFKKGLTAAGKSPN